MTLGNIKKVINSITEDVGTAHDLFAGIVTTMLGRGYAKYMDGDTVAFRKGKSIVRIRIYHDSIDIDLSGHSDD